MKRGLKLSIIFFIILSIGYATAAFGRYTVNIASTTSVFSDNNPVGVWAYSVSGAGPEYREGVLFVRKEDNRYIVEAQLSNGTLNGHDVEVKGNTLKFNLNIEGTKRVSIVLVMTGDVLEGEAYSNEGTYKVTGKRKLPPQ